MPEASPLDPLVSIILPAVVAFAVVTIEIWLARRWDRNMRMTELIEDLTAVIGEYLFCISLLPGSPPPQGSDFVETAR